MRNPSLWYAVFVYPSGKQYPVDDMQRTAFFRLDQMHTGSSA